LGACQPDEWLEAAARELLERGLRQRRIPASELNNRLRIKSLEDRLRRTGLVFRAGQMTEQECRPRPRRFESSWQGSTADRPNPRPCVRPRAGSPICWQPGATLTPQQRAGLAASLVSEIQAADGRLSAVRPHPAWAPYFEQLLHDGAGDESRTRDLNVGNVALYQLSYSRAATSIIAST
jgi:hypothetical protein